jgi:xanthosine utilization system XapX-like protein
MDSLNLGHRPHRVIALVGLAGMLLGEQILPLGKRMLTRDPVNLAAVAKQPRDHAFGQVPQRRHSPRTGAASFEKRAG